MATNPPHHPCPYCGGKLEWEDRTPPRQPGEPIRFGPNDWWQLPHDCPPGAVEKWFAEALERGEKEKGKPFFTSTHSRPHHPGGDK
jgi:hypothetical protein